MALAGRVLFAAAAAAPPAGCDAIPAEHRRSCGTPGVINASSCVAASCCYDDYNNWCYARCPAGAALRWSANAGAPVWAACAVTAGAVFCGLNAPEAGALVALDATTGSALWRTQPGDEVFADVAASPDGTVIYWGQGKTLRATRAADGVELWNATAGDSWWSPTVSADGALACAGSLDHSLYCFEARSGRLRWKYTTGDWVRSGPAYAARMVLFGSRDGYAYAVNARSGQLVWRLRTGGHVHTSPCIDAAAGVAHIASEDGHIHATSLASGAPLWNFTAGAMLRSSPVLFNGTLFFGCDDLNLYAVDTRERELLWTVPTGGGLIAQPLLLPHGGESGAAAVVIGSGAGAVFSVDARSGKQVGRLDACAGVAGSAQLLPPGGVLCASIDGEIYAVSAFTNTTRL
eukprot:TRINITY_DN52431_c0_g1_i1.p1 TRINITY_DN52431_c0_g1~~TRINITY_DN52431_c0_g1_i1.p1  ORF type:complete len:404 (+),score=76.83 TRINITY_DN52431_c0_g1_i1:73-1284(+)